MCQDRASHCQNAFRALYIYSPHKRRSEIELRGEYKFRKRKCEHGVSGQFDYLMEKTASETAPQAERSDRPISQVAQNFLNIYGPDGTALSVKQPITKLTLF